LAKQSVVCRPKDQGGIRINDREVKNSSLLGKWLLSCLVKKGYDELSLKANILALVRCPKFIENPVILISWLVFWQ
jgi:hypothetical protein